MAADLTATTPSSPRSPNFHRKKLASPWTQVVRGEPDPDTTLSPEKLTGSMKPPAVTEVVAVVLSEDTSDFSNDNVAKKSVWKNVNGVVETGTVMGGAAWPTITESTRACPKVSPSFSKPSSDGSISVSQVHFNTFLRIFVFVLKDNKFMNIVLYIVACLLIINLLILDMFCVIV